MVGGTRFELVTPTMSSYKRSPKPLIFKDSNVAKRSQT